MKRIPNDVVGRPIGDRPRRDVAGAPIHSSVVDVASYLTALDATPDPADLGGALAEDFAEFLAPDALDDELPPPDPAFREQLRRRLWRMFVVTHLREPSETH